MSKVVWPVVLVRLDALNDIIDWVGFGGVLVIALTRLRSDIARIEIIEPHAMMFRLPLPTRFIIRVLFLLLDSVEC